MFSRLIMALCVVASIHAGAQNTTTTPQDDDKFDYKRPGAPMPQVKFVFYTERGDSGGKAPVVDKKHKGKKYKEVAPTNFVKVPYKEGQLLTEKDLQNDANLFVMMFNPTCGHCQDMTVAFEKQQDLFKKSKFVLLANNAMRPYMHGFVDPLKVEDYPMFIPCLDTGSFINNTFLYQMLPQINIYDHDRKLIRTFTGEVELDSLRKYIE